MRKHNFLKAVATVLCMALLISGTAFAATPGQALDAKEVKYGTLSRADQNILKGMFNAEEYAAMNEDVVNAVGKDANKLFAHFIKYGVFEGRGPSKSFNVSAYMSSYGDLQKAFGKDIMAYYRHYNNYGKKEKRELVTVEKAEAAGVVIKSVTGATKTVLPPSVQNPSSGSSGSEVHAPIVTGIYYFNGIDIVSKTQAEYDELVESAAAEEPAVQMLSDTLFSMTVHYREDNATAWGTFKAEQQVISDNINADRTAIDNHISVNVANGTTASELLAEINSNMPGSLNYTWTAEEVVSGYTATTAGSQTVSVRFSAGAPANCSLPMGVTVVVAAAGGGGGTTTTTYSITNTLSNVTSSSAITQVAEDEPFSVTLEAATNYTLTGATVTVTMGGTDITASAYTAETGTVSIEHVTGNVVIAATAVRITYTVTNTLTNATNSNADESVNSGASYTATIAAEGGYNFTEAGASVTVTMGGTDITTSAYTAETGAISISSVTGNVVITAIAVAD